MKAMPYQLGDEAYRGEVIKRIRAAVKPAGPVSPERLQATIEALIAVAATTFMVQNGIPYSTRLTSEAWSAAYNGMAEWLNAHEQRN